MLPSPDSPPRLFPMGTVIFDCFGHESRQVFVVFFKSFGEFRVFTVRPSQPNTASSE